MTEIHNNTKKYNPNSDDWNKKTKPKNNENKADAKERLLKQARNNSAAVNRSIAKREAIKNFSSAERQAFEEIPEAKQEQD